MKKLIILIGVFITLSASGQIFYGDAWTNVPENLTDEIISYIDEKVPVGGTYVACFRNDKYTGACPDADITNTLKLRDVLASHGKWFKMIYTFQTRGQSIANNFYAFDQFLIEGVDIIAAKCGNEEYFKGAGHGSNFATFKTKFDPIIAGLNQRNYTGFIIFPFAKDEPAFQAWNNALEAECDPHPNYTADLHLYWNEQEIPAMLTYLVNDAVPSTVISASRYGLADDFYKAVYEQVTGGDLLERTFTDVMERLPGKSFFITEFGPMVGVGNLGNTLGYEATVDWFLNQIRNYPVLAVCKFNGPGTPTGSVNGRSVKDLSTLPTQVKRLDHYTQKLFLMNQGALAEGTLITQPGSYTFSVHNLSRDVKPHLINLGEGLILTERYFEYLSGENYYSSSGVCQWWANGSLKTYEIDDIYVSTGENAPALSYGYLHIEVMRVSVPGCIDPEALNYNPAANEDDGTCYYQEDCACGDPMATNEDLTAPCVDNSLCVYPPPICYEERKVFKWLGCKRDRDCSTNNCNPK